MAIVSAILSGLLLWAGFAPFEISLAPILGVGILFRLLSKYQLGMRFALTFIAGFSFFAPLLHWSSSYVGWAPWIALALLQTFIFSFISLIPVNPTAPGAILFAASFTLIELIRMKFPFGGFGWGRVGHTQVELFSAIYPLVGIAGVTFLIACLASLISILRRRILFGLFLWPFVFAIPTSAATGNISIVAIQGGVDQLGLDYNSRALGVLNRHVDKTLASTNTPDLFIWPENASDIDPLLDSRAKARILEVLNSKKTPLLVGAVLRGEEGPENVSILYNPNGKIASLYKKQDLAPFGEFMPLRALAERIAPEAKRVKDFQPGSNWVTHEIAGHRFTSFICFEVLDDDFVRSGSSRSSFLVAQTNNATFGKSPQAAQQLQIIRSRAAELHREIAVVSTTGFSAHIDATGSIKSKLIAFEPGELKMELQTYERDSLASKLKSSFWFGVFFVALWISRRSVFNR